MDYVIQFIPVKVEIKGPNDVYNLFPNGSVIDSKNPDTQHAMKAVKPLFTIDLVKLVDLKIF